MGIMGMMGIMTYKKIGLPEANFQEPFPKEGGDLLSRIALQYHRRGQA